ncbi:hypothetical protein C4552_04340 [Candidatus Parcubacteria bacterium]|nr:MAG: hypothetical protein C4552_04340 [Candidatus Parcubacteria bacterium]
MDDAQSFGTIHDVNVAVWRYIVDVWGWKFFGPALGLFALGVAAAAAFNAFWGFVAAALWLVGGIALARMRMEERFFRALARELGFTYAQHGNAADAAGNLFARGRNRAASHILEGVYRGRPMRLFQYRYVVGHGKRKHTYYFAVSEISFDGLVPDMTVDPKSFLKDLDLEWPHQRRISIRADFDDQFEVHVNEHLKIEAFEIFTPEIIAELLRPERNGYSFEFIGNKLYAVKKGQTLDRASFLALADTARFLVDALGPRLARLHDDVAAMQAATARAR